MLKNGANTGLKDGGEKPQSLLAEGTYGCTFYPPLPCKKGKQKGREKEVGKLTRVVNADYELDIAEKLREIPNWESYYILSSEDSCSRKELEKMYKDYKKNCDFLERINPSQLTHLLSPYGGITLRKYSFRPDFSVLSFLSHMATALEKMHAIGYGHFDIHEANILIDEKGVARLIDFGKSMKGDEINGESIQKHSFTFTPSFVWQPPELTVMNGVQEHLPQQIAILRTFDKKAIFQTAQTYLNLNIDAQKHIFEDFWNFSESAQARQWDRFFRHYWRKFDVWSLGVIALRIMKIQLVNTEYINGLWKSEGELLKKVLIQMLQASPAKRATINQVCTMLKER
jgi:serine/threonine protein kinase